MNLFTKQKHTQTLRMSLGLPGAGMGEGIVREFGMGMYTKKKKEKKLSIMEGVQIDCIFILGAF